MLSTRVIPCLLLQHGRLVKTIKFKNARYIGDPVNTVRIFNKQEVDELILLDIAATIEGESPPFEVISDIASECFMPVTYGGGIISLEHAKKIFSLGVEKIALNSITFSHPELITQIAEIYGSQSVVVSIDVKKNWLGNYYIFAFGGKELKKIDPVTHAHHMVQAGAGEILLTSIDRDGMMEGYDLNLINKIADSVGVPVIACGGAGCLEDLPKAVQAGASAVAVSSMAIYQGKNRSILTSFPAQTELERVLF